MRMMVSCLIMVVVSLSMNAWAVYSCGGEKDDCQCGKDNPFPCCSDSQHGPNHGNCTWWAWEQACCHWGAPALPTYGNAKDWLNEAKAAGWPTTNKASVNTVFVYTGGDLGHVGWVYEVKADGGFCSSEMGCYSWVGVKNACHSATYAQGFICKKGTGCPSTPPQECQTKVTKNGETIIDDKDPCFARFGTPNYWWEASIGYAGHMWYTYATDDPVDNYGIWTINVQDAGQYEVFAFIPSNNATTQKAKYQIRHNGQDGWKEVNQNALSDVWTSLGTYYFAAGGNQWVRLNDSTGEDYNTYKRKVGFDAIKLVPVGGAQCNPPDCNDGNPCTDDKCENGICKHINNNAPCDDGNGCTTLDHCENGKCVPGAPTDCSYLNGPCAIGVCTGGKCVAQPKSGACDDGNPCTISDQCQNGQCIGIQKDCSFLSDVCNNGVCSQGQCIKQPKSGACDDGDPCTVADQCKNGVCMGSPMDCSFLAQPCVQAYCLGGQCVTKPIDGGVCDDGDPCSTGDHCVGGKCVGSMIPCEGFSDICNVGVCEGGVCIKKPKSGPCDDGDLCTVSDACVDGVCKGVQIDCSGMGDACNDGACEQGKCIKVPKKNAQCDDGDPCTLGDACVGGVCLPGAKIACDDQDPCTKDTCDQNGNCIHQPKAFCCKSDGDCLDDQDCTQDQCIDGDCIHKPKDAKAAKKCFNGNLYWMDSCGAIGEIAEQCICGCKNDACKKGSCEGRECGSDGCGGICGQCKEQETCIEKLDGTSYCAKISSGDISEVYDEDMQEEIKSYEISQLDLKIGSADHPSDKGKSGGGCTSGSATSFAWLLLGGIFVLFKGRRES